MNDIPFVYVIVSKRDQVIQPQWGYHLDKKSAEDSIEYDKDEYKVLPIPTKHPVLLENVPAGEIFTYCDRNYIHTVVDDVKCYGIPVNNMKRAYGFALFIGNKAVNVL